MENEKSIDPSIDSTIDLTTDPIIDSNIDSTIDPSLIPHYYISVTQSFRHVCVLLIDLASVPAWPLGPVPYALDSLPHIAPVH